MSFRHEGDAILLLGDTLEELDGSEWAHVVHGHLGGRPPQVDLLAEQRLAALLVAGATHGLFTSAHDLSEGGLAQALAESCLRGGHGARVRLADDAFVALFAESTARVVLSVSPVRLAAVEQLAATHGVSLHPLGTVGGASLDLAGVCSIPLDELRAAHTATLPAAFG
jgi:phosphoribosylformylglycinamidine synthase